MGKAFIVLDEAEQVALERICTDRDAAEALLFLRRHVAPQIKKESPCMAGVLSRPEGGGS